MQPLPPPFLYGFQKFYLYRVSVIVLCTGFLYQLKSSAVLCIQQCNSYTMHHERSDQCIKHHCAYVWTKALTWSSYMVWENEVRSVILGGWSYGSTLLASLFFTHLVVEWCFLLVQLLKSHLTGCAPFPLSQKLALSIWGHPFPAWSTGSEMPTSKEGIQFLCALGSCPGDKPVFLLQDISIDWQLHLVSL